MEKTIKSIIDRYEGDKGFLVPMLQDVQKELNYLPQEALNLVSSFLDLPISRIYEVATFYKAFSLKPRGRIQMALCKGTACHVRGVPLIVDHMERELDLKEGETSEDLEYTFETVNCLGACALGPVLVVNGEYHGQMTISKTSRLLKKLAKESQKSEEGKS
ncbi:MAG: NAD(P)H-dependent oxidoreductase subunit E [Deltaproteobacteria bacterium]|jgi:NADH-quinone oxidoreductase subunit E|nr:NAD(P)H-dependent oxidoreductase subunit E [Deltaproteobacteria bacterium]MBT4641669.1 NAD(P)H-dependent oxidoreductase subunit E [Deltaproteobacteria bacterium]MBT6498574.1 NAD(P)H-dependent oxidoreductase subunit E [Deltaproteobacteria bacterium]MBT6615481.1 NAD(P)H-dependent oxidoreductase subunit E [Deltaproteobacteria bacterium]MBT7155639.1 NAD(P)H-dependent oxidoreductase subunit E [Deltaproteobacteria bacterium]